MKKKQRPLYRVGVEMIAEDLEFLYREQDYTLSLLFDSQEYKVIKLNDKLWPDLPDFLVVLGGSGSDNDYGIIQTLKFVATSIRKG